jgi:Protein of unknown function (DUF3293)
VNDNVMWDGFADAVVRLDLPTGGVVLEPRPVGAVGRFPFDGPVHIITAYNPAGIEIDEETNVGRHRSLGLALHCRNLFPTVGSAPDGSMPEPGFGVLDMTLSDALELASDFGQLAIYRWTPDALSIVDVDGNERVRRGWSLSSHRHE